jgi:hypothetical protein
VRRAIALCLPAVWACGPLHATSAVGHAEAAVARAQALDGERLAPYESVSAELYLRKAREEQGRARYGDAEELANESAAFAEKAAAKSAQLRSGAIAPPPPPTVNVHPATGTKP